MSNPNQGDESMSTTIIVPADQSIDGREHVIVEISLRAYPGWTVSHNKTTGSFWSRDDRLGGIAISAGHDNFAGAVAFARNGGEEMQIRPSTSRR